VSGSGGVLVSVRKTGFFAELPPIRDMVLDLTGAEHAALVAGLTAEHAAGHLAFGTFASSSALMTCLIFDRRGEHIHFVDGGDGGYALAARQLKAQLGALRSRGGSPTTP